ncbi:MAG: glycosyltransferase family 2 protein, partial [Kiritimatiellia bacterium]
MTKDEQLKALCVELFAPKPRENSIRIWEESNAEKLCKEPLVSVCIATYNHERWIAEALDSVLCQACDFPYEVIIGEDCSSDRTREICRDYQSRFPDKVRVFCAERNTQCVEISQAVRLACRGTYLAFLEGDDYWCDALKLQGQVKRLKETGADVCFGCTAPVSVDGTSLNRPLYGAHQHWSAAEGADSSNLPHLSSWMVVREFQQQLAAKYPLVAFHYDVQQVAIMCAEGHAVSVDEIVSCYRITGEGIWTSLSNAKAQWMR